MNVEQFVGSELAEETEDSRENLSKSLIVHHKTPHELACGRTQIPQWEAATNQNHFQFISHRYSSYGPTLGFLDQNIVNEALQKYYYIFTYFSDHRRVLDW